MLELKNFTVKPLSMVTREGLQRVDINCYIAAPAHLRLEVYREDCLVAGAEVALMGGKCAVPVLLPRHGHETSGILLCHYHSTGMPVCKVALV